MTPTEIETAARRKYNAVGDSLWGQEEIFGLLDAAQLDASSEGMLIEKIYTTSTVADQEEYEEPANVVQIKRVEYNGCKLTKINELENDAFSLDNSVTTSTGTPSYYRLFSDSMFLTPTPSEVGTLRTYAITYPSAIAVGSVLEIPALFHHDIVHYVVSEMFAKDENLNLSSYHRGMWSAAVKKMERWQKNRKRGDAFAHVQSDENLITNASGIR